MHRPISDNGKPSAELVAALLSDLKSRMEAGEKVYIHCSGGRGRAGTLGACLLGSLFGVKAEEALERVQRGFNCRGGDPSLLSPESDAQVAFVKQFVAAQAM